LALQYTKVDIGGMVVISAATAASEGGTPFHLLFPEQIRTVSIEQISVVPNRVNVTDPRKWFGNFVCSPK